jgi:hypothetical protein
MYTIAQAQYCIAHQITILSTIKQTNINISTANITQRQMFKITNLKNQWNEYSK